jgi:hypothetical protein
MSKNLGFILSVSDKQKHDCYCVLYAGRSPLAPLELIVRPILDLIYNITYTYAATILPSQGLIVISNHPVETARVNKQKKAPYGSALQDPLFFLTLQDPLNMHGLVPSNEGGFSVGLGNDIPPSKGTIIS